LHRPGRHLGYGAGRHSRRRDQMAGASRQLRFRRPGFADPVLLRAHLGLHVAGQGAGQSASLVQAARAIASGSAVTRFCGGGAEPAATHLILTRWSRKGRNLCSSFITLRGPVSWRRTAPSPYPSASLLAAACRVTGPSPTCPLVPSITCALVRRALPFKIPSPPNAPGTPCLLLARAPRPPSLIAPQNERHPPPLSR